MNWLDKLQPCSVIVMWVPFVHIRKTMLHTEVLGVQAQETDCLISNPGSVGSRASPLNFLIHKFLLCKTERTTLPSLRVCEDWMRWYYESAQNSVWHAGSAQMTLAFITVLISANLFDLAQSWLDLLYIQSLQSSSPQWHCSPPLQPISKEEVLEWGKAHAPCSIRRAGAPESWAGLHITLMVRSLAMKLLVFSQERTFHLYPWKFC